MDDVRSLPEIARLVAAANAARLQRAAIRARATVRRSVAERELDALFATSHTLAVYGTLAPGGPNHHVVAPFGGEWTRGVIEGELHPEGWGAALGYPAFRPADGGAAVPVWLLRTPRLARAWRRLDRFEGPGYRRLLAPVFTLDAANARTLYTVANVYAAAGPDAAERA